MNSYLLLFQLERLQLLREFCDTHKELKEIKTHELTEEEWANVEHLVTVLRPFNKYTKMLQSENVTLSDFFGFWTSLRIRTAKNQDDLSQLLFNEMNDYHDRLIKNPALAGAVYLDPRYQRALKGDQEIAVNFLTSIFRKTQAIEAPTVREDGPVRTHNDELNDNDSLEELEDYLNACSSVLPDRADHQHQINDTIENRINEILMDFAGVEEPLTTPVLEYWEKRKSSRPELYKIASVVNAIPPTQSSVERAFSSMPIIITSRRTKLAKETLQNILVIRLNKKLYEDVYGIKSLQTISPLELIEVELVNE